MTNWIWIDCEMTGLDVSSDRIIEIASIVTDDKLNISSLETGFYMTKVTIDGKTSTSKLIIE